ncbi:MAG: hypothetical protein JO320_27870 [Alphaproteobacteria bacterium]|nr:hypothetical protein [Alphaproteobacteria bacterium]MBV9378825.1 hypothetical protein [Alphaproteobacteria bacterium]
MSKLIRFIAFGIVVVTPITVKATSVTWSFFQTAITSCNSRCVLPPQPFVLMTLTLPGDTSTGTATWQGPGATPVYTGDSFILTVPFATLTSAFAGAGECVIRAPCAFDISWSEAVGVLRSVDINVAGFNDDIGTFAGRFSFGLTGGALASDNVLGGCFDTQCVVSGFWQSDLAVPEPMSAVLLITEIIAAWLAFALPKYRHRGPSALWRPRRVPRVQRPCRRIMLVLAQVAFGVKPALICLPPDPAASNVGAILVASVQSFFNVIPSRLKNHHTAP